MRTLALYLILCSAALAADASPVESVVRDVSNKDDVITVGGVEFQRAYSFYEMWAGSCRVAVSGARGSGFFVGASEGRCIVMTNYHVVGKTSTSAVLQFREPGEPVEVRGEIVGRWYDASLPADFAFIAVSPQDMKRTGAYFIPLAGEGVQPAVNSYIISSGAPKGRFVQAWKGKIVDYYNGSTCLFEPGPVPGQSGSAIVSEIDGQLWVTGILTWLIGTEGADDSKGGAIPISKLYEVARGKKTSSVGAPSPIPPDATECVEFDPVEVAKKADAPFVFEFTMNGCEPCKKAEADVAAIRTNGFDVYCLNISTSKDSERRADDLRVYKYPTFIVFNADGKEVARFEGPGVSARVVEAAQGALPDVEEQPEPPTVEEGLVETLLEPEDFRLREPVEQPADVDFLDESDARWRNRNRNRQPEPAEPAPTVPTPPATPEPPQIDETRLGDRIAGLLGGRLKDGLADALGNEINGTVDELERRLDRKIEDKMGAIGEKLLAKYNAVKFRLAMWFIGSIIVSVFFAEAVKAFVSWLWRKACDGFRALVNLEARRIAEKAAKLEAATRPAGTGDAIASIDAGVDDVV